MAAEAKRTLLVTGAGGQLGTDCVACLSDTWNVISVRRADGDITNATAIADLFTHHRPAVVVNCAAYTQVDACETDQAAAFQLNAEAPGILARESVRIGAHLIHLSTDYVFDGTREVPTPYVEDDATGPASVYGESKLQGEAAVQSATPDAAILRTSWVYGIHGHNFLKAVLARARQMPDAPLRVVNDQHGSPTWTVRLSEQIGAIAEAGLSGVLHATGEGHCTWYDLAQRFFELMDIPVQIEPCTTADFPRPAARPMNSILENARLNQAGLNRMQAWQDDLAAFVSAHRQHLLSAS